MPNPAVYEALSTGAYAFLDLGCGAGGSINHCLRRFGVSPGLGLEFDPALVEAGRQAGYDIFQSDVTSERVPEGCVRYVSAMDFLEHLPDEETAVKVIERCAVAARDFLVIRHPSFEDIDYLETIGLKLCWTDWIGHPNMMRVADFARAFERLGWTDYVIRPRLLVSDSTSDQIVPYGAPVDAVRYDAALHGPKHVITFDRPIYSQWDIIVRLDPNLPDAEWEAVLAAERESDATASRETVALYTPDDARWHLRLVNSSGEPLSTFPYGASGGGWIPFTGDWDGDGYDGIGLYDPATGTFYLKDTPSKGEADRTFVFGGPGGVPIAGDWTGSGRDTIGVYFPATGQWFLRFANEAGPADATFSFGPAGSAGWLPATGDWDGDGIDSVALFEPSSTDWHLRHTTTAESGTAVFPFGLAMGLPVAGDWNGDGIDSVGVYDTKTGDWYLRDAHSRGPADLYFTTPLRDGAIPVAGHWKRRGTRF